MTALYLLDPEPNPQWFPFADSRPLAELRAGAWLIRERWEALADVPTTAVWAAPHLQEFVEDGVPPITARAGAPLEGPALVGRSDFAPSGAAVDLPDMPARLVNDGATVGWWIPRGARWDSAATDQPFVQVDGLLLHGAFDLVTALEHFLVADVTDFTHERGDELPAGSIVIGDPGDIVLLGARVEPGVVFDVTAGPVVVEQHAVVRHGSRLVGPLYVGPGSEVLGGDIRASSLGPRCRVRGEMSSCVWLGYANKAHEGFLGHSVVGRWVNLGAGTTTSNLKNTYGPVRLMVGTEALDTGRQFLGTLFGDHVKTAIGTLLDTGTVIGVGANVFGAVRPPKYVPPFAWGLDGTRMRRDGFVTVAERTMPRRDVTVTDAVRAALSAIYDHATT